MDISIIGGGITGLTTAIALHKVGIPSTVYEQATTLSEMGAGIWLQPNAVQVLQWLGVDNDVINEGHLLNKMEITYPNLEPIKKIKSAVVADKYGNQTIAIHRGKLQRILYDRCSELEIVELGMPYLHHGIGESKTRVYFKGKTIYTDLVLGADGIKSPVRKAMRLPSELRKTGQICCRGIANIALPESLKGEGKEIWGDKRRFGFSLISANSVYFFAVLNQEICPEELNTNTLSTLFRDFHPIVTDMIKASNDVHTTELMDLKRLTTWHNSNTCLLGDAAHATTPNMGQGACQGIEDAFYISQYLKKYESPEEAFKTFENQRRKKVDYVVNNSWNFGRMAHSTAGQLLLKGIMKMTPEAVMSKQMNRLYTVEGL
jgi:2-polyprenyl-6-methoxyphenol hydroxylase-like FAD-dependent oxidoreductase